VTLKQVSNSIKKRCQRRGREDAGTTGNGGDQKRVIIPPKGKKKGDGTRIEQFRKEERLNGTIFAAENQKFCGKRRGGFKKGKAYNERSYTNPAKTEG